MMRRSTLVAFITLALLSTSVIVMAQSADKFMANLIGSWQLNVAKSTYVPGPAPKSNISKWEPWEGGLKQTTDGVDAQGRATHTETVMKFAGTEYPRKGAPEANTTRAFKRIDDRTHEFVEKVDGKVMATTKSVTSADGKMRTVTTTGKDSQGRSVKNVQVWEKH
jgi:hypothetical protein